MTAVWKGLVIRSEVIRDEKAGREPESTRSLGEPLTEISKFWVGLGALVASLFTGLNIALVVDDSNRFFKIASTSTTPVVIVGFVVSILAQPRKHDRRTMNLLWAYFFVFAGISEVVLGARQIFEGNLKWAAIHAGRLAFDLVLFHYGLKARAAIGRLPDEDLHEFLVDKVRRGEARRGGSFTFRR